ncbi:hypothetical protein APA_3400 [Pseudanabaena sp. lw0831]|nr:hypothetical protein APA_3400 [Pseudanabaena sp. lw0831]
MFLGFCINDKRKAALGAAFLLSLMMISEENKEILVYINVLSIASMLLSD